MARICHKYIINAQQSKPKLSVGKEIIAIMSAVSGTEKERQQEKNNRTLKKNNIWFFEQIKTIDKILVRLIRKREMEHNGDCQEQKQGIIIDTL